MPNFRDRWSTTRSNKNQPKNRPGRGASYRLQVDGAVDGVLDGCVHGKVSRSRRSHEGRPEGVLLSHALESNAFRAASESFVQRFSNLDGRRCRGHAQRETGVDPSLGQNKALLLPRSVAQLHNETTATVRVSDACYDRGRFLRASNVF